MHLTRSHGPRIDIGLSTREWSETAGKRERHPLYARQASFKNHTSLLTRQLGYFEEADVIRHGSHKHSRAGLLVPHVPCQAGEGQGRTVGLGHIQTLEDHLGERAVRPPGKEPEELNQQSKVHIVRLGRRADLVSDTSATGH